MIYFVIAVITIAADFITKVLAERYLMDITTIPIINEVFHLTYVENRGIAFGLMSGKRLLFIVLSIAVLALLGVMLKKTPKHLRTGWLNNGTALVFGGAIGNMAERIGKGYVVDFFDFRLIDFPVFNVADIAVCVGVAMLMIHFIITDDTTEKKSEVEQGEG